MQMCVPLQTCLSHHAGCADKFQKQPTPPSESSETKKVTSKVSKAQRRAQQAEFNKQIWEEAYGFLFVLQFAG